MLTRIPYPDTSDKKPVGHIHDYNHIEGAAYPLLMADEPSAHTVIYTLTHLDDRAVSDKIEDREDAGEMRDILSTLSPDDYSLLDAVILHPVYSIRQVRKLAPAVQQLIKRLEAMVCR